MNDIEIYISQFPLPVQERLYQLRDLAYQTVPDISEKMAYGMPAFLYKKKPLLYIGGFAKHIGVYALPATHHQFAGLLANYKQGKGSVQFPHNKPLPVDVIQQMIEHRRREIDTLAG